ncbi:MAG: gas vesicle protein GvpG [Chloroflexi bacterium]|nr:gas vesicle protein GvpG [Chloroflexota bacterium]
MLIIDRLLLLPFTGPIAGVRWVFKQIANLTDDEMMDDSVVRDQLLELQMALETGDIDEDEYTVHEAVLMRRLREIREYRERLAGNTEDETGPFISYG